MRSATLGGARGLASLATGGPPLGPVAAAARAAALLALAATAALPALRGCVRGVRHRGGGLLAHPRLPRRLVLLVVHGARTVVLGHVTPSSVWPASRRIPVAS